MCPMDEATANPLLNPTSTVTDLEIKDAQLIFTAVWADLLEKHGRDNLRFPREFIWLGGAPGAGKGTNTPFIAKTRDNTPPPGVISSLVKSPQAGAGKKARGVGGGRGGVGGVLPEQPD